MGEQPSSVQGFASSHCADDPGTQAPEEHRSPTVQALPSEHGTLLWVKTHAPDAGSQTSSVHGFPSSQLFAVPGAHAPLEHRSPNVHALPSEQGAEFGEKTHAPEFESQASSVQTLPSEQLFRGPGLHVPPEHSSPIVQASPSEQVALLGITTHAPVAGSQASSVQEF